MITLDTLADLLVTLNFQKTETVWRKIIGAATIEVDFTKRQIVYPDAQAVIAAAPARKQAIMQRYL